MGDDVCLCPATGMPVAGQLGSPGEQIHCLALIEPTPSVVLLPLGRIWEQLMQGCTPRPVPSCAPNLRCPPCRRACMLCDSADWVLAGKKSPSSTSWS